MTLHQYLVFITIAFFYIVSPGPAVFLAMNYGAMYGFKKATMMLLGNSTGLIILASISALGLGSLIVGLPVLLNTIKVIGAVVLFYLGVKMLLTAFHLRSQKRKNITQKPEMNRGYFSFYREGVLLALSNPKPIIFFSAIFPQFMTQESNNFLDLFILGGSFVLISYSCLNIYTLFGKTILARFLNQTGLLILNFVSGCLFIVMSVMLLFSDLV